MIKVDNEVKLGTLTELEGKACNWMLHTGYYAERGYSDFGVLELSECLEMDIKVMRGVVGSLVKKGYVELEETDIGSGEYLIYAKDKLYNLDDDTSRWED